MPSSNASCTCHIDWRPSRWLAVALVALGLMAAVSLWFSALGAAIAGPAAVGAVAYGVHLARRHLQSPPAAVDWLGGDEPAYLTRARRVLRLQPVRVRLRGPLAQLAGTDASGRTHRLAWWPDTLAASDRRQLRLAASFSGRSANPLRKQAA